LNAQKVKTPRGPDFRVGLDSLIKDYPKAQIAARYRT
jgi:hypothetical protein